MKHDQKMSNQLWFWIFLGGVGVCVGGKYEHKVSYCDCAVISCPSQLLTLCTLLRTHFQSNTHELGQKICLNDIIDEFENG